MKIAIVGGGAAGMSAAWLLGGAHRVCVFEEQPMLGGHIRTLNRNVPTDALPDGLCVDAGVVEFDDRNFPLFTALMEQLGVELEPVTLTSGLFFEDGRHLLTPARIFHGVTGTWRRLRELARLAAIMPDFLRFTLGDRLRSREDYQAQPAERYLKDDEYFRWQRMVLMYAYSLPYAATARVPAIMGIPMLRACTLDMGWNRVPGGVYRYIERILELAAPEVRLEAHISAIRRHADGVTIERAGAEPERFDKVVLAAPPHTVLELLADPTEAEQRRFGAWQENRARTVVHTDCGIYDPYDVSSRSAFDMFRLEDGDAGYNACLDDLIGLPADHPESYHLAFNLERLIDPDRVLHVQEHSTPLHQVEAFAHRDEVIACNGEQHTFHAGAWLGNGLHEGAVASAVAVSERLGGRRLPAHR